MDSVLKVFRILMFGAPVLGGAILIALIYFHII